MAIRRFLALVATPVLTSFLADVNHDAVPVKIAFNNVTSIGPEGPWWFIDQAIDFPDQFVQLRPGIVGSTLVIAQDACSKSSSCHLPTPNLWQPSYAYNSSNGTQIESSELKPASWDDWASQLLNLTGEGRYTANRMTLHADGDLNQPLYLEGLSMFASDGFQSNYPGGASYTFDAGFFSLYGATTRVSWQANETGAAVSRDNTLFSAYNNSHIPSLSYGLHIGSVSPKIPGSLVLGGYDSSRCISPPIAAAGAGFELVGMNMNVSEGSAAWLFNTTPPATIYDVMPGYTSLQVYANPAVPHMYLPSTVCEAIAQYLPVKYHPELNLYLWTTETYSNIITSPHYLQFVFQNGSSGSQSAINVPFALLNLTLSWPLVSEPQQYFPCSHWDHEDVPFHLGSAFLQAAFLGTNWETNTTFLAQAPGPDNILAERILTISHDATFIESALKPPSWESSWEQTLKPLDIPVSVKDGSLSTGAKAGIGVGVAVGALAFIAAAVFLFIRRRRGRKQQESAKPFLGDRDDHASTTDYLARPVSEAPPHHTMVEMESPRGVELPYKVDQELPAKSVTRGVVEIGVSR